MNVKEYKGSFDICSRTGDVIEPRILPHWFLLTQGLTQKIVASIESNELVIHPDYQRQVLLHKLANAQWVNQILLKCTMIHQLCVPNIMFSTYLFVYPQ